MNQYLILAVAFVGYALYKCYIYPLYLSPLRKIPGPPVSNFILGHYSSFLKKGFGGDGVALLAKQYGGIIRFHALLNKPYLLISDPKLVQKILVNNSYDYPKLLIKNRIMKEVFGEGIFLANGDTHKRQRKMMSPSFAFANIKEMVPTFVQAGHKLKDIWMKQIDSKKEERITITALIPNITLDVIGLVGFNYEFNSTTSESELAKAYNTFVGRTSPLYMALINLLPFIRKLPTDFNNRYFGSIKIAHNISEKLVAEKKNAPIQKKDLVSLLVNANEKLPVDEQLTHNELIGQVTTLLIAGHETTSIVLSWALYFLAKHPDVQDRLRKEVLDIFTNRDHFPTFDEIEHLKYLDCVFKETLRIDPPVPVLHRYNLKNETMDGYLIPKNTPLMISVYTIHHDPLIWGDDAEYFNPSRWLDPEIKSKISNNNFLPFGAGPASCLGMKLAQLEFKSILSIIIRNFEFKLVEDFTFKRKTNLTIKADPGIDLWVSKVDY